MKPLRTSLCHYYLVYTLHRNYWKLLPPSSPPPLFSLISLISSLFPCLYLYFVAGCFISCKHPLCKYPLTHTLTRSGSAVQSPKCSDAVSSISWTKQREKREKKTREADGSETVECCQSASAAAAAAAPWTVVLLNGQAHWQVCIFLSLVLSVFHWQCIYLCWSKVLVRTLPSDPLCERVFWEGPVPLSLTHTTIISASAKECSLSPFPSEQSPSFLPFLLFHSFCCAHQNGEQNSVQQQCKTTANNSPGRQTALSSSWLLTTNSLAKKKKKKKKNQNKKKCH